MTNSPEYNKHYYETHKETYRNKYNAKKRCEVCDKWISGSNFADHLKTATHFRNVEKAKKHQKNLEDIRALKQQVQQMIDMLQ